MKYIVFSVHDSKAEAFLPPWILPKRAQALRIFTDCINSADHQFGQNPADYTLFVLGEWDDHTGDYDTSQLKYSLGNGVEFIRMDSDQATEGLTNVKADTSVTSLEHESPVQSGSPGENST